MQHSDILSKMSNVLKTSDLNPIFPLARILGLIPYSSTFAKSKFWFIYSIIMLPIFLLFCFYFKMYFGLYYDDPWIKLSGNKITFFMQTFLLFSTVLCHFYKIFKNDLFSLLETFRKLTSEVEFDLKMNRRVGFVTIIHNLCSPPMTLIMFDRWNTFEGRGLIVAGYSIFLIYITIILLLCSLCHVICIHLDDLKLSGENAQTCLLKYTVLIQISKLLNDFFAVQLVFVCLNVNFVIPMYCHLGVTVYYSPILDPNTSKAAEIMIVVVQIFLEFIFFFYLCVTCEKVKLKSHTFNHRLFRVMRENPHLCEDKFLFSYVTSSEVITFKPFGFFEIGNPLVTSVIGSTTTYFFIILQLNKN